MGSRIDCRAILIPYPYRASSESQRWEQTSRNYECTFAKSRRMKHAAQRRTTGWSGDGGDEGRHHHAAINVNASVNTPRDVFHKAWISRRLLIFVIARALVRRMH